MTHDELTATFDALRLPGNPMNDPDGLRRVAIATSDSLFAAAEDSAVDASFRARRLRVHEAMRRDGGWYLNLQAVTGPRYLAIGRSTYYIPFLQRLAFELGTPVYQSDYMEWLKPLHPEESLAFYLRTAERIDVNLEGVSPDDLTEATIGIGRRVDERFELPRPFMTSWEINQLYYTDLVIPVFWHTGGAMAHAEAYAILGARVPKERIIED